MKYGPSCKDFKALNEANAKLLLKNKTQYSRESDNFVLILVDSRWII